jgi:protein-tyrosine phosphatase
MGNICRSPTAHGVMQHKVNARGWQDKVFIDSAGTHAYHVGEKSDPRSREKAAQKGIDMEFIRARKISINDYDEFDYILAMDADNLDLILLNAPQDYRAKISLFLDFARHAELTEREEVPDPYYGGASGFDDVFDLVDQGCDALLDALELD